MEVEETIRFPGSYNLRVFGGSAYFGRVYTYPLAYKEIGEVIETFLAEGHPIIVQEVLDSNVINASVDVQSQPEAIFEPS